MRKYTIHSKYLTFATMGNTIGKIFKLTTFGESHGKAIGGIIDGCPASLDIDVDFIQTQKEKKNNLNILEPDKEKVIQNSNEKIVLTKDILKEKDLKEEIIIIKKNDTFSKIIDPFFDTISTASFCATEELHATKQ